VIHTIYSRVDAHVDGGGRGRICKVEGERTEIESAAHADWTRGGSRNSTGRDERGAGLSGGVALVLGALSVGERDTGLGCAGDAG
jgi:hypothetical protein